jgi:hypothetical protein
MAHKDEHKTEHKAEHKPEDHKTEHKPVEHKPVEHKPVEHKPVEHKPDTKLPPKRVQMQKGTDEVNHGTTSYHVPRDGVVELPPEVAEHVIRQGGGKDIDPKPELPSDLVEVRHVSDPNAGLSWGWKSYPPSKDGKLHVPMASLEDIAPHGFLPV